MSFFTTISKKMLIHSALQRHGIVTNHMLKNEYYRPSHWVKARRVFFGEDDFISIRVHSEKSCWLLLKARPIFLAIPFVTLILNHDGIEKRNTTLLIFLLLQRRSGAKMKLPVLLWTSHASGSSSHALRHPLKKKWPCFEMMTTSFFRTLSTRKWTLFP